MPEPVIRPARLEDAEMASDVMTAAYPALPADPVLTRYHWKHPKDEWRTERFIAQVDGEPIALLGWSHGPWDRLPERNCNVEVWLHQAWLEAERLTTLWDWIGTGAQEDGALVLEAQVVEDEREMLEALDRLGYKRDRIEKVWELDLQKHAKRLLAEARAALAKARTAGIEIMTLADWQDPDSLKMVHSLAELTRRDIPASYPILPQTFENFLQRMSSPDRRQDRFWVAVDAGKPVALSFLIFPPVRGQVWTGYTGCHPDYRGRGLARAVKLQTLSQAIELGIPSVVTDNDSENAPMLHINESLGYDRRTGFVTLVKRVRSE